MPACAEFKRDYTISFRIRLREIERGSGLTLPSNLSKLGDATDFDPLDYIDVAGVIEASAMRTNEFAWREMIARQLPGLHVLTV